MFFFLFNLPNIILIAAAVIPAVVLMWQVYKADKLEKEPPQLLFQLVLQGVFATVIAIALEWAGEALLGLLVKNELAYDLLLYFVVVALSEEGAKYFLLKRKTWYSDSFNCQFDGVVYAVFVSLGFALAENVSYVLRYGLSTALVRAVTAVPGHACFGVFMGAFYGIAKRYDNFGYPEKSRQARFFSLLLPTLLHGIYDYIATRATAGYTFIFVIFVVIMFFVAFKLVRSLSSRDRYIY